MSLSIYFAKATLKNVCCSLAFINIIGDTEIWSPSKPMHSENTKLHLWYSQKQKSQKNKKTKTKFISLLLCLCKIIPHKSPQIYVKLLHICATEVSGRKMEPENLVAESKQNTIYITYRNSLSYPGQISHKFIVFH